MNVTISIPELNSDELFYKSIVSKYPNAHLSMAQSIRSIEKACPELARFIHRSTPQEDIPTDSLSEQGIPPLTDTRIVRHFRYAPAFLHSHTFFEMLCVFHGTCENFFESETLHMKAGDICIISPETIHAVSAFSDDCVIYNFIIRTSTFEQTFLNTLPQPGILYSFFSKALFSLENASYLYFKDASDPYLYELFQQLLEEYNNPKSYSNSLLNALLTLFFVQLLRRHEKNVVIASPGNKKKEENLIFILKYIELHADTVTLKELSSFFNYSERQMARILKDYTGKNFTALIQSARLNKACELLKHPDIPINTIIESVGYANATHFYNIFKESYRLTPAQYREQYGVGEPLYAGVNIH